MFWACAVPATLFFAFMWFVPESPRWLAGKGRTEKAAQIFTRIGGEQYAKAELGEIIETEKAMSQVSFNLKQLFSKAMAPIMILGIILAVFQQWCGINVIFNYAEEIFSAAGFGISGTLFNIVLTGSISLIFTIVAMFVVDKQGRRSLMLLGTAGLALIYLIIAAGYYFNFGGTFMLLTVVTAIAIYCLTLAPITWVLLSEIFPNRIRGHAMSVATFALWLACAVLTITFPLLNKYLGTSGTFLLYASICILGFFYMHAKLPETKCKSLEQIEKELTEK
jgi:SP family sugar porter-like MFS transporter